MTRIVEIGLHLSQLTTGLWLTHRLSAKPSVLQ